MCIVKRARFYLLALIMIAHEAPAAVIGLAGNPENSDLVGHAVAVGDFNCNGFDDLAIGAPSNSINISGAVQILYGAASGLTGSSSQFIDQNVSGVDGTAESSEHFGRSLAIPAILMVTSAPIWR
jgi:hypothetical protein